MPFAVVQHANHFFVLFLRVSEDVAEENDVLDLAQQRKLFAEERRDSDILQTNRVQHAGGGFKQPRRRIAGHGLARQALHHKSAQAIEGHDIFKLDAVAKRAAGGDDGVLQLNAGHLHAHVQRGLGAGVMDESPARCEVSRRPAEDWQLRRAS